MPEEDRFTAAVRKVLSHYISARKIEALRPELIRAGCSRRAENALRGWPANLTITQLKRNNGRAAGGHNQLP